jgi:hypothetical protein
MHGICILEDFSFILGEVDPEVCRRKSTSDREGFNVNY